MDRAQLVRNRLPVVRAVLESLAAIPSNSADPDRAGDLRRSADAVAALLREAGCVEVDVLSAGGGPAVLGRIPAPPGQPTVCLYAHHDVQPTGAESLWTSPPFTPTQ